MKVEFTSTIVTILNLAALIGCIVLIYKSIGSFKKFINRNKEMDKKMDLILNKLENEEDKS